MFKIQLRTICNGSRLSLFGLRSYNCVRDTVPRQDMCYWLGKLEGVQRVQRLVGSPSSSSIYISYGGVQRDESRAVMIGRPSTVMFASKELPWHSYPRVLLPLRRLPESARAP